MNGPWLTSAMAGETKFICNTVWGQVFGLWLVLAASPGLSRTDWTLGLGEAADLGPVSESRYNKLLS